MRILKPILWYCSKIIQDHPQIPAHLSWLRRYNLLAAFEVTLKMWSFHLKSSLMVTPSTLAELTDSKARPSSSTGEWVGGDLLKHDCSSLHLDGFSCRRFSWDQELIKSTACWSALCLDGGTISETVVSSANFHIANDPSGNLRSFISTKNNQGPRRIPWGTPAGT